MLLLVALALLLSALADQVALPACSTKTGTTSLTHNSIRYQSAWSVRIGPKEPVHGLLFCPRCVVKVSSSIEHQSPITVVTCIDGICCTC
jgi:hypothetical protein